jgi:pimeloyl-ACP methyl ester carboxylesterase
MLFENHSFATTRCMELVDVTTDLEDLVERQGRPAVVIGQSRGGNFAKVLAHTRPELVSGIVTLGSPQLDPLAIHPLVQLQVAAIALGGSLRIPCRAESGLGRGRRHLATPSPRGPRTRDRCCAAECPRRASSLDCTPRSPT